ncbi:MAG: mRNA interferase MazF [Chloroflexota bacterium]|jgi:mRNA interferase MazF|nr:mRNA interferase MazF [Chloroflexota bacterium]
MVDLEPVRGSEANKQRPAVLVSNDGANSMAATLGRGVVTVVPITSNVSRVHSFQVFLSATSAGLERDSKARAEQVRSVSVERIAAAVGRLEPREMHALEAALRLHLGL